MRSNSSPCATYRPDRHTKQWNYNLLVPLFWRTLTPSQSNADRFEGRGGRGEKLLEECSGQRRKVLWSQGGGTSPLVLALYLPDLTSPPPLHLPSPLRTTKTNTHSTLPISTRKTSVLFPSAFPPRYLHPTLTSLNTSLPLPPCLAQLSGDVGYGAVGPVCHEISHSSHGEKGEGRLEVFDATSYTHTPPVEMRVLPALPQVPTPHSISFPLTFLHLPCTLPISPPS